jgi:hypothetical protein
MTDKVSQQKVLRMNDKGYIVNAFKGRVGWGYLPRLSKFIFPFIGYFFNEDKTDEAMIEQITQILTGENSKEVTELVFEMIENIECDGYKINFDTEFSQNYDTLIMLFIEVIKLNYFDSFQRLVTNLPKG